MKDLTKHKQEISREGFTVIENVFTNSAVESIIETINHENFSKQTFRKTNDLFAIRQFLKEVPETIPLIFTDTLNSIIKELFGEKYFVVKSIYFDKPAGSNWFVSYHQDLTISVDKKIKIEGFDYWSEKQNQFAVQPPLHFLEQGFTARIHLDNTDENNGALRVIPGFHLKGIYRSKAIDWNVEKEVTCNVPKGGIMIMRPLLLHASSRTTNDQKRRVIHIEFNNQLLPDPLQWSELIAFPMSVQS